MSPEDVTLPSPIRDPAAGNLSASDKTLGGVESHSKHHRPLNVPMRCEMPQSNPMDPLGHHAIQVTETHAGALARQKDLALIDRLLENPTGTIWLPARESDANPELWGKCCSALSNAARLAGENEGVLVWGIDPEVPCITGTRFNPEDVREGEALLVDWLMQHLHPVPILEFRTIDHPLGRIVLLEIKACRKAPLAFRNIPYLRMGSLIPKLTDQPERCLELLERLQAYRWEEGIARGNVSSDEVLNRLDVATYFRLQRKPCPTDGEEILEHFRNHGLIVFETEGRWSITHLGAILLAHRLSDFGVGFAGRAIRVSLYEGKTRTDPLIRTLEGLRGYAAGFEGLMTTLRGLIPEDVFGDDDRRRPHKRFPEGALRELVANALIHQDFTLSGLGPRIEMFTDRIEISNPGLPLVRPDRMADLPPLSRNESLVQRMRYLGLVSDAGIGLDTVLAWVERFQLPPPQFRGDGHGTVVALYAYRPYAELTAQERMRATYYHAVARYLRGDKMRNASLCMRLGIASRNAAQASLLIQKTLDAGLIKVSDSDHPRAGYLPYWA